MHESTGISLIIIAAYGFYARVRWCNFVWCFLSRSSMALDSHLEFIALDSHLQHLCPSVQFEDFKKLCDDSRARGAVLTDMDAIGREAQVTSSLNITFPHTMQPYIFLLSLLYRILHLLPAVERFWICKSCDFGSRTIYFGEWPSYPNIQGECCFFSFLFFLICNEKQDTVK